MPEKPVKNDAKTEAKTWLYKGPVSTLDVPGKQGAQSARPLVTGQTYTDLPADNPIVRNLIERHLLVPTGS